MRIRMFILQGKTWYQKAFSLQAATLQRAIGGLASGAFFIQVFDKSGAVPGTQKRIKQL